MSNNSSRLTKVISRLACQCCIFVFSLAAIRDCVIRTNAGGVDAPGMLMVFFSIAISTMLFSYAIYYWRTGNYNEKELGAILFLLIPEMLIWYTFQNPSKATTFFYVNIPLWSALSIWCLLNTNTTKNHMRLLTLFFLKGAALAMFSVGILRAPWFRGEQHVLISMLVWFVPLLVATFYQMFALGIMWRVREKSG